MKPMFDADDYYDMLDAQLTEVFRLSGEALSERQMELMIGYNRLLRVALGLPVAASS